MVAVGTAATGRGCSEEGVRVRSKLLLPGEGVEFCVTYCARHVQSFPLNLVKDGCDQLFGHFCDDILVVPELTHHAFLQRRTRSVFVDVVCVRGLVA